MPNCIGGDSDHPAYSNRELSSNEILIGNTLWTVEADSKISRTEVNGSGSTYPLNSVLIPGLVKERAKELGFL